ncbi:MAG: CPBP family glutamic-type intramembrane protease, partial [Bacteroidota bacterium]|nr:CPBP family glutamic-type intramembrane protease [Bacteroidota bacterium]
MNLKPDFKKPIPWIIFIGIAVICAFFAIKNFDKANPLVSVKITMDRTAARNAAINLASRNILGPQNANTAIMFNTDDHFQNYVELEGGGLDSFTAIVKNGHYVPYQWIVRLFKEHETREVNFYFTPEGKSYGFTEKYPENVKGLALSADTARALAEKEAVKKWGINLNRYSLVEKSKETKISGRVDHTFVYEENRQKIGEATYRLRLVVSGGRLSEVKHFMKIPEDFDRRYDEMRSANNTVASFGTIGLVVVYGIGGVIIGLFFLLRKRRIIWKNPLAWGFAIAFCSVFLVTLNSIPLSWFDYDTSTSALNFLLQRILASGLFGALGMGAVIALTIMAAEGLGRLAFPRHTQLWKAWSPAAGGSISILGQTVAGYMFMAIVVALDVAYYLLARHWGWWSPASPLSDPNILANYMPWLDPFATSFQAGFWEESLCRAVPLAGIVLLTRKSKYRVLWIGAVLVLQTLIFGAAHANYPQEPSYARVFEMMLPFTIMGLIYLGFGLIPAVIAHFTVDVFWISLPLWVASSPGIWFDRLMVLVLLFIPLWIVLFYRIKQKHWNSFPDDLRNGAWKEETQIEENVEPEERIELPGSPWKKYLIPLGLAGILLWSVFTTFKKDSPPLKINRQEALKIASEAVVKQFKIKPAEWTIVGNIDQNTNLEHRFVWTKFGKQGYNQLLGKFVNPQLWKVRFVKIKGKVEERTEEYSVDITPEGKVINAQHIFPENRAGANLTKESAQVIVDSILKKEFGVERTDLEEISARPEKLNKRINWEFIYSDTVA